MPSVSFFCGRAQRHVASGSRLPWGGHSLFSSSLSVLWRSRRKPSVHTLVPRDFGMSHVACPNPLPRSPTAANSCQRCWITAQYPAEQIFLEYMLVSAVYKRQNTLLVSMLTALPSFARRSGCPRCLASCFTSLSFFAFEGTSSRTPRENGPFDGSHVAKAGASGL